MGIKLEDIQINPDFESMIPPLTNDEITRLEDNILADGVVRDPLVVWGNILVDGHNRYNILKKHPQISFTTVSKEFCDQFDAIAWLCRNQLGRRNLSYQHRRYLIGKEYEALHAGHGGDRSNHRASLQVDNLPSKKTCEIVAENYNISPASVMRAHDFAAALDIAEEEIPGIREKVLSGAIKPLQRDIKALTRAGPADRKELSEKIVTSSKSVPPRKQDSITTSKSVDSVSLEIASGCDVSDKLDDTAADFQSDDDCLGPKKANVPSKRESEQGHIDVQPPTIQEELSYEDQHEDAVNELEDAVEMFIYRWNRILSIYANILHTEAMKADITGFLNQMNTYISKVMEEINERKGTLHYTSL